MSDQQFLARLAEARGSLKLSDETAAQVREILVGCWPQRDLDRFIDTLGWICPNARALDGASDREHLKVELEAMEAVENLTKRLMAVMAHDKSSAALMLWDQLGDEGFRALERANVQASTWASNFSFVRDKQNGRNVRDSAMFVALVAHHWRTCMPNVQIDPNGNFQRLCEALVGLESLPFKLTRTAIGKGLSLDFD